MSTSACAYFNIEILPLLQHRYTTPKVSYTVTIRPTVITTVTGNRLLLLRSAGSEFVFLWLFHVYKDKTDWNVSSAFNQFMQLFIASYNLSF